MTKSRKVFGTLYKEALGIPGLDVELVALGFDLKEISFMRNSAERYGNADFEFSDENADAIAYAAANTVRLMMRGVFTQIVHYSRFDIGDTVRFKSGGPIMTVCKVNQPTSHHPIHTVDTLWGLDGQGRPGHASKVPERCLVSADPPA